MFLFSEPFTVYKHCGRMTVFLLPVYRTEQFVSLVNTLHKDVLKPGCNKVKSVNTSGSREIGYIATVNSALTTHTDFTTKAEHLIEFMKA